MDINNNFIFGHDRSKRMVFHKCTHKELLGKPNPAERKFTINELRKKHRLQEIPDGNIVLVPISGKEEHEEKR